MSSRWFWILIFVLVLANAGIYYALAHENRGGQLTVAFLDVGQGDAIYIEAPNGNQVLIDGGPGRAVLRSLSGVLPFYDRSLDLLVATHPDADHIGGLPDVLRRFRVANFAEPGVATETGVYRSLTQLVPAEGAAQILARRGQRVVLDDGVYLDILFPDRDPVGWETNRASIVARLTYGEIDFLLTGDAPAGVENYLVSLGGESLQSEVLKAGHHGSKTSSAPEFVAAVSPDFTVISAGRDNRYGHPHQQVLDTLIVAHTKILRTDESGTIIFKTNGRELSVVRP